MEVQVPGYRFNQIIAIQSLEANECRTSSVLLDYIRSWCVENGLTVEFKTVNCYSAGEFRLLLGEILLDVKENRKSPLIHIECHGDESAGLVFENGSELSWKELTAVLREINIACSFNLFVVCTACYGFHCISAIDLLEPAPFYAVLAPSHTLDPGEIIRTLMSFYRVALDNRDIGIAYRSLSSSKLCEGYWFCLSAEQWYEKLMLGFATNHCSESGLDVQTRSHFRKLQSLGRHESIGHIKRKLILRIQTILQAEGFRRFFATDILPANAKRFESVLIRVLATLKPPVISSRIKLKNHPRL